MSEGFLGRWSRRKLAHKEEEASLPLADAEGVKGTREASHDSESSKWKHEVSHSVESSLVDTSDSAQTARGVEDEAPLPTEEDLTEIQKTGNISSFLSEKVSQDLRNKAFKELFKIPSFNHVDMLDVYMEDFNKFTPLSVELRDKMTLAKQLLKDPNEVEPPKELVPEDDMSELVESAEDVNYSHNTLGSSETNDEADEQQPYPIDGSENKEFQSSELNTSEPFDGESIGEPIFKPKRENP